MHTIFYNSYTKTNELIKYTRIIFNNFNRELSRLYKCIAFIFI